MTSNPSSPLATGGAGTILEYRVAAVVLAALLRGDRVEGFSSPVLEVGLQQRVAGNYLDDVVACGADVAGLPVQIEYQVKRTLVPTANDTQWKSVIEQCVAALDADEKGVTSHRHRLGVAATGPRNQLTELRDLTQWARVQATEDNFERVMSSEKVTSAKLRQRWQATRDVVEQVLSERGALSSQQDVDIAAFRLVSALRVWLVDVDDGGADHRHALDRLGDLLLSRKPTDAADLFLNLVDIAQGIGSRAGRVDRGWLHAELTSRGIQLRPDLPGVQLGPPTNLPARNAAFTGRDEILLQLVDSLRKSDSKAVAIHGLGGVGKSQLALELAYRLGERYSIIWWMRADTTLTLSNDFGNLAPTLGLTVDDSLDANVTAVKAALNRRQDWLLIFDNAIDQSIVAPYLPTSGGNALITSRQRDWRSIADVIQLNVMTIDESVEFLQRRTGREGQESATELAQELGNLPLALSQAGAYIAGYDTSVAAYLALYRQAAASMLSVGPIPSDYPSTVATTWLLHFEALATTRPAALDVLRLCSFMAPDSIPVIYLLEQATVGVLPEALATALEDPVERDIAIGALASASLIDRSDDLAVTIHRLVQAVTVTQLSIDDRKRWANRAIQLVLEAFPDEPDQPANWPVASALLSHGLAASRLADECQSNAVVERADLLNAMAIYVMGRADIAEAKTLFERSLALKQHAYGTDHPEFAVTLDNLGLVLTYSGEPAVAKQLHQQALAVKTSALGSLHPTVALTLNNLAAAEQATGDFAAACRSLERASAITEAMMGPDSPEFAATLRDLGMSYATADEHLAAIQALKTALGIFEGAYGTEDPRVAQTKGCLAVPLNQIDRYQEAADLLQSALVVVEDAYGPEHPETARVLGNLGDVLDNLGNYAQSRACLERAVAIVRATVGPEHPDVGRLLLTLAVVLGNLHLLDEAQEASSEGLQVLLESLGPDHPDTQRALVAAEHFRDRPNS